MFGKQVVTYTMYLVSSVQSADGGRKETAEAIQILRLCRGTGRFKGSITKFPVGAEFEK